MSLVEIGIRLARLHSREVKWIYVTRYGHVKSPNVARVNIVKQGRVSGDLKIKFPRTKKKSQIAENKERSIVK